ncbi:MAG: hypothetical protein IPL78_11380 [Chloroflexi bacterium]|nr:hypothetical protein [Chloroflexota bacterium]
MFETISQHRHRRLVEIGVLHGVHARQMIQIASLHHPANTIHYFGFDLFEELNEALLQRELSKKASPFILAKGIIRHLFALSPPRFVTASGITGFNKDWSKRVLRLNCSKVTPKKRYGCGQEKIVIRAGTRLCP